MKNDLEVVQKKNSVKRVPSSSFPRPSLLLPLSYSCPSPSSLPLLYPTAPSLEAIVAELKRKLAAARERWAATCANSCSLGLASERRSHVPVTGRLDLRFMSDRRQLDNIGRDGAAPMGPELVSGK